MTAPHQRAARSGSDLRVLRAAVFAAVCVVLAAVGHTLGSCDSVPLWTLGAGFLGVVAVAAPLAGRERSRPGIAVLLAVGQTLLHTLFGLGQHGAAAAGSGSLSASVHSIGSMGSMGSMGATGSMGSMGSVGSVSSAVVSDATLVERAARLVCGTTAAAISPAQAYKILTEARLSPAVDPAAGTTGTSHHAADAVASATNSASLLPSLPMLLAHVLAAIAAGWLLRRGDLALLRIIDLSALSARTVAEGALVRSLRGALALVRALRAGLPGAPEAGPPFPSTAPPVLPEPRTLALQHTVIRRGPPAADLALAA
jgi:hypothetical protein